MPRRAAAAALLLLAIPSGGCSDNGDPEVLGLSPPRPRGPDGLHRHPPMAKATAKTLAAATDKLLPMVDRLTRYGFFADLKTPEARRAFLAERLALFADAYLLQEVIDRDFSKPSPQFTVNLLEFDPQNLLTLELGIRPAALIPELALLSRGAVQVPKSLSAMDGVVAFESGEARIHVPAQATPPQVVEALNRHAQVWGGAFHIFELEGEPVGVAFFKPEFQALVEADGFNPYRP